MGGVGRRSVPNEKIFNPPSFRIIRGEILKFERITFPAFFRFFFIFIPVRRAGVAMFAGPLYPGGLRAFKLSLL